ncbi:MAG: nucleotidyl transferase AbiEii/AbiGii toxin family protein [Bacteroidota bacterium]|nr:nucleotidyl transferase AbiEii/AbiGii toxin family protein [Bacteroidota bacterium]
MHWLEIDKEEKFDILNKASLESGLEPFAVEKDWWMVQTLRLIWQMDVAEHLVFKGGSSLSKGWGLIERFSEDIDLALDREFLDFSGDISRTQVGKLRDASYAYISNEFYPL